MTDARQGIIISVWEYSRLPLIGGRVKCSLFLCPFSGGIRYAYRVRRVTRPYNAREGAGV
nr:MAG TPA: hypothetical protein [Caudoviricetes sp.]